MQRKFLVNLGFLLLLNLLVKPFYIFGIDAQVQNELSDAYGNYFALINLSLIFNILLDLGVNNFNTRQISRHPQLGKKNVIQIVNLRSLLFVVYVIVVFGVALTVGYNNFDLKILGLLVFNQFLIGLNQYFASNFKGFHQFKRDAIMSVMDKLLLIVFCGILLWTDWLGGNITILSFVLAQTLAYFLTFAIAGILTLSNGVDQRRKWSWQFNQQIIKKSLPYALLILLMSLYSRIDSVMLERMVGDGASAEYAQGYRIMDAFNMFALLFASLLLPIFARTIKEKMDLEQIVKMASKILIFLGLSVSVGVFFFGESLLKLIYDSVSNKSVLSFNYLIFGFLGMTFTYVFGTLLTANGSLKKLNILALISLGLNVVLNLILIPILESVGASLATLVTQIFMGVAQLFLAQYIFKFRVNVPLIVKFSGLAIVLFLIGWLLNNITESNLFVLAAFAILALISGLLFKILEPKAVIQILKEKD